MIPSEFYFAYSLYKQPTVKYTHTCSREFASHDTTQRRQLQKFVLCLHIHADSHSAMHSSCIILHSKNIMAKNWIMPEWEMNSHFQPTQIWKMHSVFTAEILKNHSRFSIIAFRQSNKALVNYVIYQKHTLEFTVNLIRV